MSYLKYLFVIILVQASTAIFIVMSPENLGGWTWFRVLVPTAIIALVTAFWLQALIKNEQKSAIARLQAAHAKEREKIKVNAERAKTRLMKKNQEELVREVRKTQSSASFSSSLKAAGLFSGVAVMGGFLLLSNFMLMGALMLTTAGGAVGGYWLRLRQDKGKAFLLSSKPKIVQEPSELKQVPVSKKSHS
jgi:Flp pilus assembly protein TadB